LTDVDDSEEDTVSPPVIKPDPDPSTNNTQVNSTRNDAGGRYNLRNLNSNNVNYKSLNEVGKQYVQIKKEKKERRLFVRDIFKNINAICMTQMMAKKGNSNVRGGRYPSDIKRIQTIA